MATTPKDKERPLSDDELRQVRDLIERDKRVSWVWSTLKTFAVWITAVVLGFGVGIDVVVKVIKWAATK